MKIVAIACFASGLVASASITSAEVMAADLTVKAMPAKAPMPAPVSWTGFYVGGQIGGGGASRFANPTANDPVAAVLLSGGLAFLGDEPVASNRFNISGLTGGIETGYNWQVDRSWLVGIEADFSGSNLKGGGSGTSFLQQVPGATFTQTLSVQQRVDWYGTLRGRLGWLPTQDLLLFVTGGFAYGNVTNSGTYMTNGESGAAVTFNGAGFSFRCVTNSTCFTGSSASTRTGWTLGGGGEWMFWRNWSAKVEYQYVNLGGDAVTVTATAVGLLAPGATLSSFNANFPRDDFHVVRAGVNYHF